MKFKLRKDFFFLIVVLVFTIFAYSNIFQNKFVWDDNAFIYNWEEKESLGNVPKFFMGNLPKGHEDVYRPVRSVFYAITHQLFGTDIFGYHLFSLLIHLGCIVFVFLIIKKIVNNEMVAFLSSLLFGLHPLHTSAITFITASFDQLGILFYFASFYLYILFRNCRDEERDRKRDYFISSVLFAILALFTYELALTLPFVIIIYDLYFGNWYKRDWMSFRFLKKYIPFFFSLIVYFSIRSIVLGRVGRTEYLGGSFYLTMLAMSKAFLKEIFLLILPVGLNVNHIISDGILAFGNSAANKSAILSQSLFEIPVLLSIIVALLLLFGVYYFYNKGKKEISFSIVFFLLTLGPVTNIIPIGSLLDEDFLYLPSFGYCFALGYLTYFLYNKLSSKDGVKSRGVAMIFVFLLLFFSFATYSRNADWKSDLTIWTDTATKSPISDVAYNNLGIAYHDMQDYKNAISSYEKAVSLNPENAQAYYNLGGAYRDQGDYKESINSYISAISANKDMFMAYNDMARVYRLAGDYNSSIKAYELSIAVKSDYADTYNGLGNTYKGEKKYDGAIMAYEKAISLDPKAKYYSNLGVVHYQLGDYTLSKGAFDSAISIDPNLAEAYFNLGLVYLALGDEASAQQMYQKALSLNPMLANT